MVNCTWDTLSIHDYCQTLGVCPKHPPSKTEMVALKQNKSSNTTLKCSLNYSSIWHSSSVFFLLETSNKYLEMQSRLKKNWNSSTCKYTMNDYTYNGMHGINSVMKTSAGNLIKSSLGLLC